MTTDFVCVFMRFVVCVACYFHVLFTSVFVTIRTYVYLSVVHI